MTNNINEMSIYKPFFICGVFALRDENVFHDKEQKFEKRF